MKNQIVIPSLDTLLNAAVSEDKRYAILYCTYSKEQERNLRIITNFETDVYNAINDPALHRDENF